jgi:TANFOR domain-containing protein
VKIVSKNLILIFVAHTPRQLLRSINFLLFFFFVIQSATAQVYPVQGNTTLLPPYTLRLSDYATSTSERMITNVLLTDVTKAELPVRFRLVITGQNVKIETKPEYLGTSITLQGGVPLRLSNIELAEYFDVNHLNFSGLSKSEFMKTGQLPEGFYTFCWEVYEAHRNVKISNSICAPAWLILNDPPLVNLPRNGEKLKAQIPQNVMIQWTPRHTGSPNSAFTTEYEIKIVEVWSQSGNPNDAILSQPAIYETTTSNTTLIYGPDATQLEPGRRYALRVQAKAMSGSEQTDLFKNNGYSETVTFIYGDACDAPTNITAQNEGETKFSLQWDEGPTQTGYTVHFREAGKEDGNWYSTVATISTAEISGLKAGTAYEYQVMSTCGNFESSYSTVATITTEAQKERSYSCGVIAPDFNLDPSQLLPVLKVGEVVNAGDFDVTITKVAGSNGTFSGEGAIVVPFLNQVRARVTFTSITVNKEYRMVNGVMSVTGGGIEIIPSEALNTMDKLVQGADKVLSTADSLAKVLFPEKPDPAIFIAAEEIKIEGGIKRVYKNPLTGQVIVEDNNGKSQTLPAGKDVALTDSNGKGVLVNSKGGITNTTAEIAHAATRRELHLTLSFTKSTNTKKGLDLQKEEALKGNYEKLGDNYYVAWKAVATDGGDGVKAVNGDKTIKESEIRFAQDGTKIETAGNLELLVYSVETGIRSSVVAKVVPKDTMKKEQILGKLNVVSYEHEAKKLHIVRVNNAKFTMEAKAIEASLNEIYGQAVVSWEVEVAKDNLLVSGPKNPFDDGNSGLLSNYTDDMKMVINAQGDLIDDEYYLFVIDKPASGDKLGYMPRGKQAGFIFTDPHGTQDDDMRNARIVTTMAHELGHGAFTLKHTFAENTSLTERSTDNLMDYNNGTQLWKTQWDRIHDPVTVLGLFESDESGAMTINTSGLTALVNSDTLKTDKVFIITGNTFKLDTKYNVANGGEVKFRLTIKPEGGGAEIQHPSDDWKKVQNNENWILELNSVLEGKYILSYKVGTTTTTIDFYIRTAAHDYACSVCGRNLKLEENTFSSIYPLRSNVIKDDPNSLSYINEALKKGGFTTCYRQAHFLSQVYAESGGLKASIEKGDYSVKRILEVYFENLNAKDVFFKQSFWSDKTYLNYAVISLYETATSEDALQSRYTPSTFKTFKWKKSIVDTIKIPTEFIKKDSAEYKKTTLTDSKILQNKKNLYNLVYANINGNGNQSSGDGYKFRGRGAIQLTGRGNYRDVSNKCNQLFATMYNWENDPTPLENDAKAIIFSVAGYLVYRFVNLKNLDTKDVTSVTKKINGGTHGLSTRMAKFNEYLNGRLNNCKLKK